MTFAEIWAQLCRKQPSLEKEGAVVEFKSQNLKSLLRQVYEQGQRTTEPDATRDPLERFKSIFGGR